MSCCQQRPVNLKNKQKPEPVATLPLKKQARVVRQALTRRDFNERR